MSSYLGCVSYLDGTYLVLQHSLSDHGEFNFNWKKQSALNVPEISESRRKFTFVQGGFPSSVSDATVFCGTAFFKRPNCFFLCPDVYILVDKAYRLTRHYMTSYKEPLASPEAAGSKKLNLRLAMAKVKIENAFEILKNGWGLLRSIHINIRRAQNQVRVLSWMLSYFVLQHFFLGMPSLEYTLQGLILTDDKMQTDLGQRIHDYITHLIH